MAWKVVMVDQRLLVRARLCVAVSRLDVRWQVLRGVRARALSSRTVFNLRTGALHIVVVIVIIAVVREAPLLTTVHRHPFFRGRGGGVEVDRVLGFTRDRLRVTPWCSATIRGHGNVRLHAVTISVATVAVVSSGVVHC